MSVMMKLKKAVRDDIDTFDVIMKSFEDGTLRDDVTGELIKSVDVALVEAVTSSGMTLNKAMKPRDLMKLKQYGVEVSALNKAIEVATTKKVCYSSAVDNALYALKNQSLMLTDEEIAGRIEVLKSALSVMSDGEIKDLVFTTLDKLKAMKSLEDDVIWKMQDVIRSMIRVSLEMNKSVPERSFLRVLHKGKMYDKVDGEYVPFDKAKYIKREGSPGNYKYTYKEAKGRDVKSDRYVRHERVGKDDDVKGLGDYSIVPKGANVLKTVGSRRNPLSAKKVDGIVAQLSAKYPDANISVEEHGIPNHGWGYSVHAWRKQGSSGKDSSKLEGKEKIAFHTAARKAGAAVYKKLAAKGLDYSEIRAKLKGWADVNFTSMSKEARGDLVDTVMLHNKKEDPHPTNDPDEIAAAKKKGTKE